MTDQPPKMANAPGLVWKGRKNGWAATWQARSDLVKRGYLPKTVALWRGVEPDTIDADHISTRCRHLQSEMLMWGRGVDLVPINSHNGTVRTLINCYQTDPYSPYAKNRFHTRQNRDSLLRRIAKRHGHVRLSDIRARVLIDWHKDWSLDGARLATGRAIIAQFRALFSFGATLLEDPDCERLCGVMSKQQFPGITPRGVSVTAEYAEMIRVMAHERFGWHSIALAQAFQFECTLRQKDVIGEWVPLAEPGVSAVIARGDKWLRGILWQEIDANLILRHVTSKKQKETTVDLKLAPMVMAELRLLVGDPVNRDLLPATGPVIVSEITALPWSGNEYRRKWRRVAQACGIPDNVWNMDSRSGAISEAIQANAPIEWVRHAATHSDVSQTADYDRTQAEATAKVMKLRMDARTKKDQN